VHAQSRRSVNSNAFAKLSRTSQSKEDAQKTNLGWIPLDSVKQLKVPPNCSGISSSHGHIKGIWKDIRARSTVGSSFELSTMKLLKSIAGNPVPSQCVFQAPCWLGTCEGGNHILKVGQRSWRKGVVKMSATCFNWAIGAMSAMPG
jgi:hypothetical protein